MSDKDQEFNPYALIGVGACITSTGAALNGVLSWSGAGVVSIGLIAVGALFMVLGFKKRREWEPDQARGDNEDQPPA
jgi:hypothetical protein